MSKSAPTTIPQQTKASVQTQKSASATSRRSLFHRRWIWLVLLVVCIAVAAASGWFWQVARGQSELNAAQAALDRHELPVAADHLNRYLEYRPRDAAAWLLAARTARRLGRLSDAEAKLTRAQELGGVTTATRLEWDLYRVQQGDLGDIHTRLRATITPTDPEAPLVLEALARGYLANDRLMDAMEACDLWIDRQPEHPWPWLWRGGIYERLANFDQALADYQEALRAAPADSDIHLALAELYIRGRRPEPAEEHFQYVVDRDPHAWEAIVGLAGCKLEEGNAAAALPLLERVPAGDAVYAEALTLRGKAALELHDAAAAEKYLRQAVKLAGDDAEAWHQLILALRRQDKHVEADELAPRLEVLRRDMQRLDQLTRSIARSPEEGALRQEAGVIALRIGRTEDGLRLLESALRCGGDVRPAHAALARYYEEQHDSRAEFHRHLAEDP